MENQTKARLLFFSALVLLDTVVAIPFIDYHNQFFDHELVYQTNALETEDIGRIVNETVERLMKSYPNNTLTVNDKMYYDPFFNEWYSPPIWRTAHLPNGTHVNDYFLYFYRTGYSYVFNALPALIIVVLNCVFAVIIYDPDKFFPSPKIDEFKYD